MNAVKSKINPIVSAGVFALFALFCLSIPKISHADFNPNLIISDYDFTDTISMNPTRIQNFLNSQPGGLATQQFATPDGPQSVAQIIYNAGQAYSINPKVILVTLQKEMSLLTISPSSSGYQNRLNAAMGYGCPDSGGCDSAFSGFYSQIDRATKQFRRYYSNPSSYRHQVGGTYTFNDVNNTKQTTVTVLNQGTANLYNYTPHVYNGNYNFYLYWNKWFGITYPDGTLLRQSGKPGVFVIVNGTRRGFMNSLSFISRGLSQANVISVPLAVLENYPLGEPITIPDNTVVSDESGNRYLINGFTKRPIPNDDVFNSVGFVPEEVVKSTATHLSGFYDGTALSADSAYPGGALLQNKSNGAIGYIENGVMHMIASKEIWKNQFPKSPVLKVSTAEFNSFPHGSPILFKDGTLVRSPKSGAGVYIISNGKKRLFTSRQMFDGLGYKMKNVVKTSDSALDLHPTGDALGLTS